MVFLYFRHAMCTQVSIYIGQSLHHDTRGGAVFPFDKVTSRRQAVIGDRTPTDQHTRQSRHSNCRWRGELDIVGCGLITSVPHIITVRHGSPNSDERPPKTQEGEEKTRGGDEGIPQR